MSNKTYVTWEWIAITLLGILISIFTIGGKALYDQIGMVSSKVDARLEQFSNVMQDFAEAITELKTQFARNDERNKSGEKERGEIKQELRSHDVRIHNLETAGRKNGNRTSNN